jgi:endoglucanase
MHRPRNLTLLPVALLCALLVPAAAHADATSDPSGFHLQSSQLSVNENAGQAVITIERSDTSEDAQIRYITLGDGTPCGPAECTAVDGTDFTSVKGELDFPVGAASETFSVPIVDHGVTNVSKTIQVALFGPSPIGMASPSKAVLTVLDNDAVTPRDPQNPLALPVAPTGGNPLAGATFFVDPESEAAHAAESDPALDVIAREPGTARFGSFSFGKNGVPDIGTAVSRYLSRAQVEQPGTVPLLATYRILHGLCGHASDSPADAASYENFINGFASGIGSYRAVLFLEMDSIITMPCLSRHGQAVREAELR